MGVLRDTQYWNSVVQQMVPFRPAPGEAPSEDDVERLLRISCSAFTQLVNDPELPGDLEVLVQSAKQAVDKLPNETEALGGYLKAFREVEGEILRRANVPEDAFCELDRAIAELIATKGKVDQDDYKGIEKTLNNIQKKVCTFARSGNWRGDDSPVLGKLLVGAAAGTLVGAADMTVIMGSAAVAAIAVPATAGLAAIGAAAATGAGLGAVAGFSLNVPVRSWGKLWKNLSC
ncbi:hypothetical protein [Rhizobium sp. 768_B6_N1_8]|uniref:hypothetical protein n=1 Tax=unclassified Rhizobium TaxID=2613769 RepID=UPI003F1FAD6C